MRAPGKSGGYTVYTTGAQYFVKVAPNLIVLTFTCDATNPTMCQSDTQSMVESLLALPQPSAIPASSPSPGQPSTRRRDFFPGYP